MKRLVILFGSQAAKTAGGQSDTDVAVLFDRPLTLEEKLDLRSTLSEKLGVSEEKIDLVDLWVASPLLQYQIAQNGKLVEGEEFDFIRFKVLAWKRYQDTAKFRRVREKVLNKEYAG
ncbi:MAG: nucleotidyltransferase domain-containing protein [Parcubacteria group bacterium]|nr:nucleotidyltransferase domain-containing protein [Parcubacteria group bacterium]